MLKSSPPCFFNKNRKLQKETLRTVLYEKWTTNKTNMEENKEMLHPKNNQYLHFAYVGIHSYDRQNDNSLR